MDDYKGIKFCYADTRKEIAAIKRLAVPFLDTSTAWVLDNCETDLANIQSSKGNVNWQTAIDNPIRTRISNGEYRASPKASGKQVFGEMSFQWQIQNADASRRRNTHFILLGIASTSLKIRKADDNAVIASWQFEAGDASSPGTHFHSAVNQYEKDGLFPEWLKVPRFQGLMLTPFDGLDFLLGELFQVEWNKHVSKDSDARNSWAKHQKSRLQNLLEWQIDRVKNADTTPWNSLKRSKPPLELLN